MLEVAPRAGAWIEIIDGGLTGATRCVAPRAGAWIEITFCHFHKHFIKVAPRAGAWIEIFHGLSVFNY